MSAQRKYPKGRGELVRIARLLGVHPETLRTWIRQAEIDGGTRPGTTAEDTRRIVELEREMVSSGALIRS